MLAWGFLCAASVLTGLLIDGMGAGGAVSLVLLLAAIKARGIVLHYMELQHALLCWRLVFERWVLIAASVILALWWYTAALPAGGGA